MADYIYSLAPSYPYVEEVMFSTTVEEFSSINKAAYGTPVLFNSYSYSGTPMPSPQYPIKNSFIRIVETSDDMREVRRDLYGSGYETFILTYAPITTTQKNTLVQFFIDRKGRYDNFLIQLSEASPYTSYSPFSGTETRVRFDEDSLMLQYINYDQWVVSIRVVSDLNIFCQSNYLVPYRKFTLKYSINDLSTLITFFKTTVVGASTLFNFNPSSICSLFQNVTYTVRFDLEAFERTVNQINQDTATVILLEKLT